jgi:hypothetical protein
MAICTECGAPFYRSADQQWKTRCGRCWWRGLSEEERKRRTFKDDTPLPRPAKPAIERELAEYLPLLIQLCHPDRHSGSPASNKATVWLLKLKERINCGN